MRAWSKRVLDSNPPFLKLSTASSEKQVGRPALLGNSKGGSGKNVLSIEFHIGFIVKLSRRFRQNIFFSFLAFSLR